MVGFDETGTRIAGRTCWVHTACTRSLTLYLVHTRRGVDAFEAMDVLPDFTGLAVHDGWKPYKTDAGAVHALQRAPPARTRGRGGERDRGLAAGVGPRPRRAAGGGLGPDQGHPGHPRAGLRLHRETLERITAREEIIAAGRTLHPPRAPGQPRRKRSKPANLLDRLDAERDQVLRFAFDWRVPFDSNTSEQAIRINKVQQKITGGWRTMPGAERFLRGYLSTATKQGKNLLDAIIRLFDDRGAWIPTPT
ncbi:transposase [Streptomyces sp. NBC_00289]